jgi:predicted O-linked N-acetylglucosamine transferase (SPINDLY family)
MRELGLPDLVASSEEDFVQKAVRLAKDTDKIRELRAKIAERRAKLFRDLAPVRALERCLIEAAGAPTASRGRR